VKVARYFQLEEMLGLLGQHATPSPTEQER
jgi:hypothetical protein